MCVYDSTGELHTGHLLSDIRRRSVRGGAIMLGAQALKVAVQFCAVVVMARLLPPTAFGLIAMVAALNTILDLVKDLGLSAATIQRSDITHAQVSALFWINAGAGALITAALFVAAPAIADFYAQPALVSVTRWLSVVFLVSGLTTQHWALLRRQMRFATIAAIEMSAEIVCLLAAIGLALHGAGYWSLVAQRLIAPILVMVGSWSVCQWRPSWPARAAGVRDLFQFGASITGCNILAAMGRSVDQVLIGWLWGPAALGLYERAAKLLMVPINNINAPIYGVGMPALSRLAGQDARFRHGFGELLEKLAMITMPAAALVTVTADWVTDLLFGPRWGAAASLVACFGFAASYYPLILVVGLLYIALNRQRELMRATLVDAALSILSILAGFPFGLIGVAISSVGTGLVLRMPVAFWLSTRRGPVQLVDLYKAVLPSALAAVAAAAAVWVLRHVLLSPGLTTAAAGLALAAPAAVVTASVTFLLLPQSRSAITAMMRLPQRIHRAD